METGYNQETAEKLLTRFIDYSKIIHNPKTKEIGIVNWPKYNPMESPKTRVCVEKELKDVKDKTIITAIYPDRYPIQGASQEEEEEEQEQEKAEAEAEEESPSLTPAAPAVDFNSSGTVILSEAKNLSPQTPSVILSAAKNLLLDPLSKEPSPNCHSERSEESQGYINDYPDYTCASIQMQSELLFIRIWNKQKPNPEEIRIAADYIMKFSFNEVEIAFTEAVKYDRKKLAYVEAVCEKRKERADLKKKTELEKQKRLQQEKKLEEERKSGVGLGLIKTVFPDG